MTVFLLPDGTPFYGGTYFPKESRYGLASFRQVLAAVAEAYRDQRESVLQGAEQLSQVIRQSPRLERDALTAGLLEQAETAAGAGFDERYGGFGGAPKFPQPMNLEAMLRLWRRSGQESTLRMVRVTLEGMARGGMYDRARGLPSLLGGREVARAPLREDALRQPSWPPSTCTPSRPQETASSGASPLKRLTTSYAR